MDQDEKDAAEARSRARVASWPLPDEETLVELRHLLNPPDIEERLAQAREEGKLP